MPRLRNAPAQHTPAWVSRWLRLLGVAALCSCGAMPIRVAAESGIVEVCPPQPNQPGAMPNTSRKTGLVVRVDTTWAENYGYRPVRFRFESPKPSTSDREIAVRFYAYDWRSARRGQTVEKTETLPAGAVEAEITLAVPQHFTWYVVGWQVSVDGVLDPTLSRWERTALAHPGARDDGFTVLQVSDEASPEALPGAIEPATVNTGQSLSGLAIRFVKHPLPREWLQYSSLDAVSLTVDQLVEAAAEPEAFAALKRWVASGGSLWVEEVGDSFGRATEVTEVLGLEATAGFQAEAPLGGTLPEAPEWRWVKLYTDRGEQGVDLDPDQLAQSLANLLNSAGPTSRGLFAEARLGFGRVAIFSRTALGPRSRLLMAGSRYWARQSWVQRHGLSPDAANADFSDFLIPGVGLAPVTEFRVLITLFVLIAGPLNFWLLSRRHRTHLMVLTVPLTALVLTGGLFAYALMADGFGVVVRARSVTFLDQASGERASWSRLCYYAGMAPSEGLTFDANTAVYPLLPGWNEAGAGGASMRPRARRWSGPPHRLERGGLGSRESTQLLTVQSGPTDRRIDFRQSNDRLLATNQLGVPLQLLIVIDVAGQHWLGEAAPVGEAIALTRVERGEAVAAMRKPIAENQPTPPEGLQANEDNPLLNQQRRQTRRRMRQQMGIDYAGIGANDNLLNQAIDQLTGLDGGAALALPPKSYLAITEKAGAIDIGLESADETDGFHIVIGKW
ncbi:MAG: hypothetical protein AAF589_07915 [Planctomycetota bacterium]